MVQSRQEYYEKFSKNALFRVKMKSIMLKFK